MVPTTMCLCTELGPFGSKGWPGVGAGPKDMFSSCNSWIVARLATPPPLFSAAGGGGCPMEAQARASSWASGVPAMSTATLVLPVLFRDFMLFQSEMRKPLRNTGTFSVYSRLLARSPQKVTSMWEEPWGPELSQTMMLRFGRTSPVFRMVIVIGGRTSLMMPFKSTVAPLACDWIWSMVKKEYTMPGISTSSGASSICAPWSKVMTTDPLSNLGLLALSCPPVK
mmetsp:Transcript_91378/g.255237  ORF Transcript_91378/g.255237 Transcript_91378/m.255237 type:complete len:225 (+) Transcript_91378:530-1204(+)